MSKKHKSGTSSGPFSTTNLAVKDECDSESGSQSAFTSVINPSPFHCPCMARLIYDFRDLSDTVTAPFLHGGAESAMIVTNIPLSKMARTVSQICVFCSFFKLTYLRRYWTDFKNFGSFETGKFFSNRIQKGGSIVANLFFA